MIRFTNECVGCTGLGLPCMGSSCPNRKVPRIYCDRCEEELDPNEVYGVDDEDLCEYCLKEEFHKNVGY